MLHYGCVDLVLHFNLLISLKLQTEEIVALNPAFALSKLAFISPFTLASHSISAALIWRRKQPPGQIAV